MSIEYLNEWTPKKSTEPMSETEKDETILLELKMSSHTQPQIEWHILDGMPALSMDEMRHLGNGGILQPDYENKRWIMVSNQ